MADAQTIPVTNAALLEALNHPEGYMRYANDFFRGALGDLSDIITEALQLNIYSFEDTELPDDSLQIKYVHTGFAGLPVKSITFSPDRLSVRVSEGLAPAGSPLFDRIRNFVNPPTVTGTGAAGAPMGGGRRRSRRQQRKTKSRRSRKQKSQRKTKSRRHRRQ